MESKLISIIVPAYNEQDCLDALYQRLCQLFAKEPNYKFEVILVDNGSMDETYNRAIAIHKQDPRFKVLQLVRNFLPDGGISAGLSEASGDAAVILYADLEDPPELIHEFIRKWEEGYQNVYGIVKKRHVNWLRNFNSRLFYWLVNKLSGNTIPVSVADFRLADKSVYQTINEMPERNRFLRGMFAWTGHKSIGIEFSREKRHAGQSKAPTTAVLRLAAKGIFAFSYFPLRLITYTGLFLSVCSFLGLVVLIIRVLTYHTPFAGFGTIVGIILLLFGFLFTMLGIMSEYIAMIFEEVKQRPLYIISNKNGFNK